MYYGLVYYPNIHVERINQIRRKHDPTVDAIALHMTVMFPVPDAIEQPTLIDHIENIVQRCEPFPIRIRNIEKSPDHWMLLTLAEGDTYVVRLYRAIYSGILAEYRREDIEFVPHVALGLFVRDGVQYDWSNPHESDFDEESYRSAVRQVEALCFDTAYMVDKLHLVKIPDEVIEWASGKKPSFPSDLRIVNIRSFSLGQQTK